MAVWIQAILRCYENGNLPVSTKHDFMTNTSSFPFDVELFVENMRNFMSGDQTVRIPCTLGILSDFDTEVEEGLSSLEGEAWSEWTSYVMPHDVDELDYSGVDFKAIQELYADYPGERNA
jgi:hypothetical protein